MKNWTRSPQRPNHTPNMTTPRLQPAKARRGIAGDHEGDRVSTAYIDDGPQLAIVRHQVACDGDVVMDRPLSPAAIGGLCERCGEIGARCSVRVQGDPGDATAFAIEREDCCAECAPGVIERAVGELSYGGRVVVAVLDEPIFLAVAA